MNPCIPTTASNRRQRAIGTLMEKLGLERQQQLVTVFFLFFERTSGTLLRMQSFGSIRKKHKTKEFNSGRPDLTPLSFMAQCLHWKSGKHQRRLPKDPYATTSSENRVEDCLASTAGQTITQRAIVCLRRPLPNWFRVQGVPQKCSTWRPRKSD